MPCERAHRPTAQTQTVPSDGGASFNVADTEGTHDRRYTEGTQKPTAYLLQHNYSCTGLSIVSEVRTIESGMYKEKIIK